MPQLFCAWLMVCVYIYINITYLLRSSTIICLLIDMYHIQTKTNCRFITTGMPYILYRIYDLPLLLGPKTNFSMIPEPVWLSFFYPPRSVLSGPRPSSSRSQPSAKKKAPALRLVVGYTKAWEVNLEDKKTLKNKRTNVNLRKKEYGDPEVNLEKSYSRCLWNFGKIISTQLNLGSVGGWMIVLHRWGRNHMVTLGSFELPKKKGPYEIHEILVA